MLGRFGQDCQHRPRNAPCLIRKTGTRPSLDDGLSIVYTEAEIRRSRPLIPSKLPDVLERKDLSRLDGAEAFRVYELLPEQEKHDSDEIYPRHLWSKVNL